MFDFARALIRFVCSLVRGFFRAMLRRMPSFLCAVLDSMAGVFGGLLCVVAGVFHILLRGVLRGDGRQSYCQDGTKKDCAEKMFFH